MTEMNDDFDRTMSYLSGDAQPADKLERLMQGLSWMTNRWPGRCPDGHVR